MTGRRYAPLTAEQRALASDPRYLRLASRIAEPYARAFPRHADEFRSEALLALCQAARTFEPGRKLKYSNHATNRINGAMLDLCRQSGPSGYRRRGRRQSTAAAPRIQSLDRPIRPGGQFGYDGIEGVKCLKLADVIAADEGPVGWEAESRDELIRITRHLPVRHRSVIRFRYGHAETRTLKAIARSVGLSESRVSEIHSQAIEILREG